MKGPGTSNFCIPIIYYIYSIELIQHIQYSNTNIYENITSNKSYIFINHVTLI